MINTVREYKLLFDAYGETVEITVDLERIINDIENEFEYIYALQDEFDTILDMKKNDIISFQFNRDDAMEKGIIKRIK